MFKRAELGQLHFETAVVYIQHAIRLNVAVKKGNISKFQKARLQTHFLEAGARFRELRE